MCTMYCVLQQASCPQLNKTFEAILLNFSGENSNFITNLGYDSPFLKCHHINQLFR